MKKLQPSDTAGGNVKQYGKQLGLLNESDIDSPYEVANPLPRTYAEALKVSVET